MLELYIYIKKDRASTVFWKKWKSFGAEKRKLNSCWILIPGYCKGLTLFAVNFIILMIYKLFIHNFFVGC